MNTPTYPIQFDGPTGTVIGWPWPVTPHPDHEQITEDTEAWLSRFPVSASLSRFATSEPTTSPVHDPYERGYTAEAGALWAAMTPDAPTSYATAISEFMVYWAIIDDLADSHTDPAKARYLLAELLGVIRGNGSTDERFLPFVDACDRMVRSWQRSVFAEEVAKYVHGVQQIIDIEAAGHTPAIEEYLDIRRFDIGADLAVLLGLLGQDPHFDSDQFYSAPVQNALEHSVKHFALCLDLILTWKSRRTSDGKRVANAALIVQGPDWDPHRDPSPGIEARRRTEEDLMHLSLKRIEESHPVIRKGIIQTIAGALYGIRTLTRYR
ncbi:terpene synthase family protein [Streptomyces sp. NPDC091377]|uniref:terpene synthase family protein n=1 Tax=Streptomyces sp. NPDC091377 TaxID=3365995 RepID=UPI0038297797